MGLIRWVMWFTYFYIKINNYDLKIKSYINFNQTYITIPFVK